MLSLQRGMGNRFVKDYVATPPAPRGAQESSDNYNNNIEDNYNNIEDNYNNIEDNYNNIETVVGSGQQLNQQPINPQNPKDDGHITTGQKEGMSATGLGTPGTGSPPSTATSWMRPLKNKSGWDYRHLLNRDPKYSQEFTTGVYNVSYLLRHITEEDKQKYSITEDTKPEDIMKKVYKWDDEDIKKYVKGKGESARPPVTKIDKPEEREKYQLHLGSTITQGPEGKPFDTTDSYSIWMKEGWSIYVMDRQGQFFAAQHKRGLFHHSSLLAGSEVAGAGELEASKGKLKAISNKSGHYQPTEKEMMQVLHELDHRGVDLSTLELYLVGPDGGLPKQYDGTARKFYNEHSTKSMAN